MRADSDRKNPYPFVAGMGALAGIRSLAPPALLSLGLARRGRLPPAVAALTALLAAGEMAADKTSVVPDRTEPIPLLVRALSGAFVGAVLGRRRDASLVGSALVGANAAAGSALLFYHLRREARLRTGIPDSALGVTEDAIVLLAGLPLTKAR